MDPSCGTERERDAERSLGRTAPHPGSDRCDRRRFDAPALVAWFFAVPVPASAAGLERAGAAAASPAARPGRSPSRASDSTSPSAAAPSAASSAATSSRPCSPPAPCTRRAVDPAADRSRPTSRWPRASCRARGSARSGSVVYGALRLARRRGRNYRHALIVGTGPRACHVRRVIERNPGWGFRIVGYVDEETLPVDPTIPAEQVHKLDRRAHAAPRAGDRRGDRRDPALDARRASARWSPSARPRASR